MSNLLLERSAQMGRHSLLPKEYQQVEYIESTGTQWIDTGIIAQSGIFIYEAEMRWTKTTSQRQLLGANYGYYFGMSASGYYELGPSNVSPYPCSMISFDKVVFKSISSQNKETITVNGSNEYQRNVSDLRYGLSIHLYNINPEGYGIFAQIKSFKIILNDTVERDFIPCYCKADNTIGMYDIVTQQFFTNSGTGNFSYGL